MTNTGNPADRGATVSRRCNRGEEVPEDKKKNPFSKTKKNNKTTVNSWQRRKMKD